MVSTCDIVEVGKSRAGYPRFWCRAHGAGATGKYGVRLASCESAHLKVDLSDTLDLNPAAFPGGIALWGAVSPVYDTSGRGAESGIHVHARLDAGGEKIIDATYPSVTFDVRKNLFTSDRVSITEHAAVAYLASRVSGRKPKFLYCVHCGAVHLDADYYAVHPHHRHLCHSCGKFFQDNESNVSNPIALIQKVLELGEPPPPVRPGRCFDIKQKEFPGGIQLWGSNPALVWTAEKDEEEGIHVHAYPSADSDEGMEDNTFDDVRIDGIRLDDGQLRYLMVQQSLAYLKGKIVSLDCPSCGLPHFDEDDFAFHPHADHDCHACGARFRSSGRNQKTVSNPMLRTLLVLSGKSKEE